MRIRSSTNETSFAVYYAYTKSIVHILHIMKNKVWFYRTQQNITLRELSRKSGISIASLDRIENDQTQDLMLSTAIALSKALHVDLYELFCID